MLIKYILGSCVIFRIFVSIKEVIRHHRGSIDPAPFTRRQQLSDNINFRSSDQSAIRRLSPFGGDAAVRLSSEMNIEVYVWKDRHGAACATINKPPYPEG